MRHLLFSAVIVGAGWVALTPAMATSLSLPGLNGPKVTVASVEKSAIGSASTGAMAILHPMSIIRRPTATIRLPPCTPIRHPFMATNRRRPRCLFSVRVWRCGASARRQRTPIRRRRLRQLSSCRGRLSTGRRRVRRLSGEWLLASLAKTNVTQGSFDSRSFHRHCRPGFRELVDRPRFRRNVHRRRHRADGKGQGRHQDRQRLLSNTGSGRSRCETSL